MIGGTTFNKCTTIAADCFDLRSFPSEHIRDRVLGYLNAGKTGLRYTTWFGAYDSTRYSTAKTHFGVISNAMDTAAVTFDCGCKKKFYAYVYANQPYTIYLCSVHLDCAFDGYGLQGRHADPRDEPLYRRRRHERLCLRAVRRENLALTNPNNAVNNADNHEYFAENTPAQP